MPLRTFIALDLDAIILDGLAEVRDDLADHVEKARWTERQNLHVTLHFLGDVAAEMAHEVCDIVQNVASQFEPFDFDVRGAVVTPPRGLPRMVWANIVDPTGELVALHDAVTSQLTGLGLREEERGYKPHITLARIRFVRNPYRLHDAAAAWHDRDFGVQHVDELVVYSSHLTKEGPLYTPMSHAMLG
jgi:2'-5' RNA ligase